MGRSILLAMVLALTGCATQIMEGYVGKPVQAVMVDYGPPAAKFSMPDGRTAYQWRIDTSGTMPVTANTQNYGNGITTTTVTGGQSYSSQCYYTMYARTDAAGVERIEGFEKPKMMCS